MNGDTTWKLNCFDVKFENTIFAEASMPAVMTMLADHAAQQLLDFNQKLDINLLDNVVNCLYHGVGPQVGHASYLFALLRCMLYYIVDDIVYMCIFL